jgi:hypothetical protein
MRASQFTVENTLDEAPMNPTAFAQSIEQGEKKGVLVGYEFEVCIPRATISNTGDNSKGILDKIEIYMEEFLESTNTQDISVEEMSKLFPFKKPIKGYDSLSDYYTKDQTNRLQKGIELFKEFPEDIRAKFIPITKQRLKSYSNKKADPKSMSYQIAFLGRFGRDVYSSTRGEIESKAHDLMELLDGNDYYYEMFGTLIPHTAYANMLKYFNIDPARVWSAMQDYVYDEEDDDGYYAAASGVLKPALSKTMGSEVIIFSDYHEDTKDLDKWYIEPDGSLSADDEDDTTAEIVSPPLPAMKAIDALKKFYSMASSLNLYTNNTTGLHINVSIPDTLDVTKLAVFLGDDYVLQQYNRENNGYAKGTMQRLNYAMVNKLDSYARSPMQTTNSRSKKPGVFGQRKTSNLPNYKMLNDIIKNHTEGHTASISYNGKYISFRHAGGDYLSDYNKVYNTVGRFVRAMIIASDPNLYKREYQEKLAKIATMGDQLRNVRFGDTNKMLTIIQKHGLPVISAPVAIVNPKFPIESVIKSFGRNEQWFPGPKAGAVKTRPSTEAEKQLLISRILNADTKQLVNQATSFVTVDIIPKTPQMVGMILANPGNMLRTVVQPVFGRGNNAQAFFTTSTSTYPLNSPIAQAAMKAILQDKWGAIKPGAKTKPNASRFLDKP